MKRYKPLFQRKLTVRFNEALRFSDLQKHAGISDLTDKFRKIRNKQVGREVNIAKLVALDFQDSDAIFIFSTKPGSSKATETDPARDFALIPASKYRMEFKIIDFLGYVKGEEISISYLKEIIKVADIQLFCSCPAFQYQGSNYILTTFYASIYPENRPPERWNQYHNDNNFVCKHLSNLIATILGFWINPMTSMLNKRLRDLGEI